MAVSHRDNMSGRPSRASARNTRANMQLPPVDAELVAQASVDYNRIVSLQDAESDIDVSDEKSGFSTVAELFGINPAGPLLKLWPAG